MSIEAFRAAYARDSGNVDFGEMHAAGDLAAGQVTPWYNLTPKKAPYVLGALVKCIYVLTATGPASPVAGSDVLDPILNGINGAQIDVGPSPGTAGRSQSLTRAFAEFIYAATTNTSFTIASLPTFASAGSATITVSFFVPLGGAAGAFRIKLPSVITQSYAAGVTVAYTSITTQVVSTTFSGVVAFRQEKTPTLGTGMQSILTYLPKDIAPDVMFMDGESSTTITQVMATNIDMSQALNSTDTDALEIGASSFAPISGATYTTSAGFVATLSQKTFSTFQMQFASSASHYIGFLECSGGDTVISNLSPQPTQATPAVSQTGSVTASGNVSAAPSQTGHGGGARAGGGRARGRHTYGGSR
jgi:hypothetical protein